MSLEPTAGQRSQVESLAFDKLALAQFYMIKDQDAFALYTSASIRAISEARGQRTHNVRIDQVLAGGEMPYHLITVDSFPSSDTLLSAFDSLCGEREQAFSQIYALVVHPDDRTSKLAKSLGILAPILRLILGTNDEREMTGFDKVANPETGPVPGTVAVMREHNQNTSFFMMNLNKYYPQAQYADGESVSGESAYNQYSNRIAPYLISVGGYPDIFGQTVGLLVGNDASPLHDDWSDFAMVYYPSRRNFINMMTHTPRKGVHHRNAGLQKAVLMPASNIP